MDVRDENSMEIVSNFKRIVRNKGCVRFPPHTKNLFLEEKIKALSLELLQRTYLWIWTSHFRSVEFFLWELLLEGRVAFNSMFNFLTPLNLFLIKFMDKIPFIIINYEYIIPLLFDRYHSIMAGLFESRQWVLQSEYNDGPRNTTRADTISASIYSEDAVKENTINIIDISYYKSNLPH